MSDYSSNPDEDAFEFDRAKAKEQRAQDAEQIRQDFIKSQRLPVRAPVTPKPLPSSEDER